MDSQSHDHQLERTPFVHVDIHKHVRIHLGCMGASVCGHAFTHPHPFFCLSSVEYRCKYGQYHYMSDCFLMHMHAEARSLKCSLYCSCICHIIAIFWVVMRRSALCLASVHYDKHSVSELPLPLLKQNSLSSLDISCCMRDPQACQSSDWASQI